MRVIKNILPTFRCSLSFHNVGKGEKVVWIPELGTESWLSVDWGLIELAPIHLAQALTYLRLSNLQVGLLLNFNAPLMKESKTSIEHHIINALRLLQQLEQLKILLLVTSKEETNMPKRK
ncbi:MAG: hypothetical protein DHS20C18_26630 [Saprospiraceae bacterium]|nr:MAG: hypothetical protein DHS20C18_26630 [Saprospiraceae bacterium]